jgi:hypothetical protein
VNTPFRYTAGYRAKIRDLLPLTPPRTQVWSSPPLRLPTIIPSSTVQVQTVTWALTTLERLANMFLDFENEFRVGFYTYRDIEAALNRARVLACKTSAMRQRADSLAEMAREAKARFDARKRQSFRRTDWVRDWYFEKLLFVWEQCGGATRASAKCGHGGPLVRYLQLTSGPVFARCRTSDESSTQSETRHRKALTADAAVGAVRKLLTERRNQSLQRALKLRRP